VREGRAIWIREVTVEQLGGEAIVDICHDRRLNVVLPQVPWLSGPLGKTSYWEQHIRPMMSDAHALGLEVHPWVFFLDAGSIDNDESLMQVHKDGSLDARLGCPANPEVVRRNVEKGIEVLENYDVDGLSLEDCFVYHNWKPEPDICYCTYCRKNAPESPSERKAWLRRKLTDALAEVRREAKRVSPLIKISAAARSPYEAHSLVMSADWKEWCRIGFLEFLAPMVYTKDLSDFRRRTKEAVSIGHEQSTPVYAGVGAHWDTAYTTPDELADQVSEARALGSDGLVFFHLGGVSKDQWDRIGVAFQTEAVPAYRE